jgi:diaminohydroxyphosphoribosylaminopyrimidine deaminase/5-amino-6-(5-phosphoribosylamino)uracil reductase
MHKQFLLSALEQAKLGRGSCAPNPSVGAVAVQNGQIIAQAYHKGAGTLHAEQLLLAQFPALTPEVSLYVTLEPCNHWGKTPPCVDAIISHGISQVIYGYTDPNQLVAVNDTPALLRAQGISVIYHPIPEIDAFYTSYTHWMDTGLPWVTAKIAQTLDGKIAGEKGARLTLSNELCADFTHEQRAKADIILTTAQTMNNDDPLLTARLKTETRNKPLAIIDSALSLNPKAKALTHARDVHIFHGNQIKTPTHQSTSILHATPASDAGLDLSAILKKLGMLGYHDVWVEAGGTLFSALHREKLVNRTYVYLVPSYLGIKATDAFPCVTPFCKPFHVSWQAMGDNMILCMDWKESVCLQG